MGIAANASLSAPSEQKVVDLAGQVDGLAAGHQQQKPGWDFGELAGIADDLGQQVNCDSD